MAGPPRRHGRAGQPDAGPLGADIASFRLHLAAEGKAARTVQGYTSAVRWFAAGYLLGQAGKTRWEQVSGQDIEQWMVQLLDRYRSAYGSIQFPGAAAVLQVAGRRGRAPRPDEPAPRTAGGSARCPGVHQRRTIGPGEDLPR